MNVYGSGSGRCIQSTTHHLWPQSVDILPPAPTPHPHPFSGLPVYSLHNIIYPYIYMLIYTRYGQQCTHQGGHPKNDEWSLGKLHDIDIPTGLLAPISPAHVLHLVLLFVVHSYHGKHCPDCPLYGCPVTPQKKEFLFLSVKDFKD